MNKATPDYRDVAKVFWSGRSQAVRLPAACRFKTSEVEVIKEGDRVTLRPRGKDWGGILRCEILRNLAGTPPTATRRTR